MEMFIPIQLLHDTNQIINEMPDGTDIDILYNGEISLADTTDINFGTASYNRFFVSVTPDTEIPENMTIFEYLTDIVKGLIDGRHNIVEYN